MAYGDTSVIQQMVWGDTKVSIPGSVTAANSEATTLVNLCLNRNTDYDDPPTQIVNITSIIAAEFVRNPKVDRWKIREECKALCKLFIDQSPSSESRWGNVSYS